MPAMATSTDPLRQQRQPVDFFRKPAPDLARALLGAWLVHGPRAGMIVETEAYLGPEDAASHARFGPTERTRPMFGPGGTAYVYLCYGIHQLFNVVSGTDGEAGAVLIRALAPGPGLPQGDPAIARGPGKLTRALAIDRRHSGLDLTTHKQLYIAAGPPVAAQHEVGPRVGVDYAGRWAHEPLRFWIADHPAVSRTRTTSRRTRPKPRNRHARE